MTALAMAARISTTLIVITPRNALCEEGKVSCALIPIADTTSAHTASRPPQT